MKDDIWHTSTFLVTALFLIGAAVMSAPEISPQQEAAMLLHRDAADSMCSRSPACAYKLENEKRYCCLRVFF